MGACGGTACGEAGGVILEANVRATGAVRGIVIEYDRVDAVFRTRLGAPDQTLTLDRARRRLELTGPMLTQQIAEYPTSQGFLSQVRFHVRSVTALVAGGGTEAVAADDPEGRSWEELGWTVEAGGDEPIDICLRTGVRADVNLDRDVVVPAAGSEAGFRMKPGVAAEWSPGGSLDGQEPGPVPRQLTVVFRQGVPRRRVHEINDEIGACALYYSDMGPWHRIKVPDRVETEVARRFYESKPEVEVVMEALNFGTF